MRVNARNDFSVSYNSADEQWAEWISHVLEEAGYRVVVQAWDFRPGGNLVLEMEEALRSTDRLIAVFSPDYLAAPYPQPEWASVLADDPEGKKKKKTLVPVMVRRCEPTGLLSQMVQIRIHDLDDVTATEKLLDGVKAGRGKPAKPPAFPGAARRTAVKDRGPSKRVHEAVESHHLPTYISTTRRQRELRGRPIRRSIRCVPVPRGHGGCTAQPPLPAPRSALPRPRRRDSAVPGHGQRSTDAAQCAPGRSAFPAKVVGWYDNEMLDIVWGTVVPGSYVAFTQMAGADQD